MPTAGCPACVVEAMQSNDENWFRILLTDPQLSYNDTFSIPKWEKTIKDSFGINWKFPIVPSGGGSSSNQLCSHVVERTNLLASNLFSTTISLVQMSIICSTQHFNSLQMLIDSGKFDFSEPIIFHEEISEYARRLRVENVIVLALEADTAHTL